VKCGRIIGAELPAKTTKELIEEVETAIKSMPIDVTSRKLILMHIKNSFNQIHTQSALEAEGRKHPNLSEMKIGSEFMTPRMYRALAHNQALTDIADYHRSKVIE